MSGQIRYYPVVIWYLRDQAIKSGGIILPTVQGEDGSIVIVSPGFYCQINPCAINFKFSGLHQVKSGGRHDGGVRGENKGAASHAKTHDLKRNTRQVTCFQNGEVIHITVSQQSE